MILKRMLAAALGALGLGALASGPAFGQAPGSSNIPAPDIFDDQITCTQLLPTVSGFNLPSTVPKGGETSPLDDIIGMGINLLTADDTTLAALTDGPAKLEGLGYVIPAMGMNCGSGPAGAGTATGPTLGTVNMDTNGDGDLLDVGDTIAWGSIPKDVADGYSDLLTKYVAVYGDPGGTTGGTLRALEAAQKLLDNTDSTITGLVEARTRSRDAAAEAHNKALAAFNAASSGPIYQAGVAEWMAKAAVSKSIADYNTQVTKTNMALSDLNGMLYANYSITGDGTAGSPLARAEGASKYVPLANASLVGTVVTIDANGMGTVVTSALETYTGGTAAVPVAGTAGVPAMGTTDAVASSSGNSNFTALGELIVPMSAVDHDTDSATPLVLRPAVTGSNAVGTNDVAFIRTTVENVRIAAAALKKARDENTNPRFQDLYDEAYRRAMLEQNYYDAVWAQVLADNTDTRTPIQRLRFLDDGSGGGISGNGVNEPGETTTNPAYVANPLTIASRNAAYNTESGKRMAQETSLRGLVAAREMATANVVGQFTNAQSFYQQLVDRRQAEKTRLDRVVMDATNPTDAQTKAAADAGKALDDAQAEKTKIDALFPANADNPVVDLVSTLLKTGGDDGQALVDAISDTYDGTQTNKDKIDTLEGRLTDADGNPIDLTNLGDTEAVEQNTTDIEMLDGRVTKNETDIAQINTDLYGDTSSQHADASACAEGAAGLLNTANCADARSRHNAADIADLGGDIEALDGRVGDNEDAIAANTMAIEANDMDIAANTMAIEANDMDIAANTMAIEANDMDIAANTMAIEANDMDIAANAEDIMTNAGHIMTNAGNIMENEMSIGANAGNISSNADAIAANMNSIGQNSAMISDNRNMIGELSDDLDVVRAGVAASMALAGMPAVNGRGIAIGVGSFDGESAFAVGFQIQGEQASFKVGVTSSGGATGASAGVGFNF